MCFKTERERAPSSFTRTVAERRAPSPRWRGAGVLLRALPPAENPVLRESSREAAPVLASVTCAGAIRRPPWALQATSFHHRGETRARRRAMIHRRRARAASFITGERIAT